jgi:oxygen-independent coproporphyrinogen-3 oxidase
MQAEPQFHSAPDLSARGVTAALLARYDRPGPRYTSYPTAVQFDVAVDAAVYAERLKQAGKSMSEPLSLYVHLPFCEHRCLFCGCNVIISPDKSRAMPYLDLLLREAALVADRLGDRRRLSQVHLGGGTPTYFAPEHLSRFLVDLFDILKPIEGAELAVEIDPRVTTNEHIDALAEVGFNRISLGVQDFTPEVQETIGRVQTPDRTHEIIERARSHGFAGINVDLIYGLPRQSPGGFANTLQSVIDMGADRAAVYSFAYVPWMHGHMKKLPDDTLPDRENKLALFALARERFIEAGYEPIGMDHFAKPHDELAVAKRQGRLKRNFQGYCVVPAEDVVGLGISAIGDIAGAYVQNAKKLSTYREAISAGRLAVEHGCVLSEDDKLRRRVIHELMCNFRIDIRAIERRFSIDFANYFTEDLALLRAHVEDGMVTITPDRIDATPMGELFVRNLAMCFDAYLRAARPSEGRTFSRTV